MSEVYNLKTSGYQQGKITEDVPSFTTPWVINTTNFIPITSPMSVATIESKISYYENAAEDPVYGNGRKYMTFSAAVGNQSLTSTIYRDDITYVYFHFVIDGFIDPVEDPDTGEITTPKDNLICSGILWGPKDNLTISGGEIEVTGNPSGGVADRCGMALWGHLENVSWGDVTAYTYNRSLNNLKSINLGSSLYVVLPNDTTATYVDIFSPSGESPYFTDMHILVTDYEDALINAKMQLYGYSEANTSSEIFHTELVDLPYTIDWTEYGDVNYFRVELQRGMEDTQHAFISPTHVETSTLTGSGVWALDSDEELTNAWLGATLPEDLIVEPYPARYWYYDSATEEVEMSLIPSKTIANGAFAGCEKLNVVMLPASLTSIGREAFAESGLRAVTIPNNQCTYYATSFPPGCVVTGGRLIE